MHRGSFDEYIANRNAAALHVIDEVRRIRQQRRIDKNRRAALARMGGRTEIGHSGFSTSRYSDEPMIIFKLCQEMLLK